MSKLTNKQKEDIKLAKELFYPEEVIRALETEKDSNARIRILINARHESMKEGDKKYG